MSYSSPGIAERDEGNGGCNRGDGLPGPGNGGCNRSDGLPPVPGTPVSRVDRKDRGWMDKHRKEMFRHTMPQQSSSHSNNKQMCHRMHRDLQSTTNLDASGQGYPVQGCQQGNMQCKDKDQHGLVRNGLVRNVPNNKRLCSRQRRRVRGFGCVRCAWSGGFPNLGVNPMNYQGNMPSGPVWSDFGRFDASSSADPRGHGHVS